MNSGHPQFMSAPRDVTPHFNDSLKKDFSLILNFLKNPIEGMKLRLDWSWKRTILIHVIISIAAGVLNGLIPPNVYNIAYGLIFLPLITFVTSHLLAGFFYYYFQVFEKRTVDFLPLLHMVVLTNVPYLAIHTLTSLLPPLTLLGLCFSGLLLVVGLADNFKLDRKRAMKLVAILVVMIFAVWLWEKIDVSRISRSLSGPYQDVQ